jgi:hypothetical protein
MSVQLPDKIRILLAALEADVPEIQAHATPAEFWIVFSVRAGRIQSISSNEDVQKGVSKSLADILKSAGVADRRLH